MNHWTAHGVLQFCLSDFLMAQRSRHVGRCRSRCSACSQLWKYLRFELCQRQHEISEHRPLQRRDL